MPVQAALSHRQATLGLLKYPTTEENNMTLLCIDESGNTQETIALSLVVIPDYAIEALWQIFTLRPNDPPEIKALYERDPEKNKRKPEDPPRPRNEFKYSDFINAENVTNLPIYREFINEKISAAAKLPLKLYCTIFDKPIENEDRILRINLEAQTLLHMWTKENRSDALSKTLKINADRQVFSTPLFFQVYERRNQWRCEIFPKAQVGKKVHYGGRENSADIEERSSKEFKPLQFADFAVGVIRESKIFGSDNTVSLLKPLTSKNSIRDIRGNYSGLKGLRILK